MVQVLCGSGCQVPKLANPNNVGEHISEQCDSRNRRQLLQADSKTPLPGGDKQTDGALRLLGVTPSPPA